MNSESYAMRINTLREFDDKKEEKKLYKKGYKLRIQIWQWPALIKHNLQD